MKKVLTVMLLMIYCGFAVASGIGECINKVKILNHTGNSIEPSISITFELKELETDIKWSPVPSIITLSDFPNSQLFILNYKKSNKTAGAHLVVYSQREQIADIYAKKEDANHCYLEWTWRNVAPPFDVISSVENGVLTFNINRY